MNLKIFSKIILSTVILTLLNFVFDWIIGTIFTLSYYVWLTVSNFLIVLLLGYYITHSTLRGLRLVMTLFTVFYIIGHFNIFIEALVFDVTDPEETIKGMVQGILICFIISPFYVFLLKKWDDQSGIITFKKRFIYGWTWRVVLGVFFYVLIYGVAGFILQAVFPELLIFYKDKIPPFDLI